jgi:NADH-quinone oxidoreductase subunit L
MTRDLHAAVHRRHGQVAQFPLHVWLPDSMEGPTPISALIHAATMVTAGIFMVARMSPLFELSETALSVVLVIGAITALFMGWLGSCRTTSSAWSPTRRCRSSAT